MVAIGKEKESRVDPFTFDLDYYTMDIPDGKLTIVNVPFYEGDTFAGVVEFIFEGSLA